MIYLVISQILIGLLFIKFYKYLPVLIIQNNIKIHSGGYLFAISLINFYFYSYIFLDKSFELILFPLIAFIIGAIDDKFNINPLIRIFLLTVLILSLVNYNSDYNINFLIFDGKIFKVNSPFDLIFTCLCFLLLLNSINFSDGINCLAGLIFLFYFAYMGIKFEKNVYLHLIIIFSLFLFLFMNWKNKCYLGDAGVYLLSFLISQIIILNYKSNYQNFNVEEIFLILYLPGYDLLRLFFYRLFKKKSPFEGDKNHIHHLLLAKIGSLRTLFIYLVSLSLPVIFLSLLNINYLICIVLSVLIYISLLNYAKN
tara:strand:- start:364 stop:1296 length:933 start_codon:yes stop_codon:yes gene_type:complete